jgi:hypothetical protein
VISGLLLLVLFSNNMSVDATCAVADNVNAAPCVTTPDCGWLATGVLGECFTCTGVNEKDCDNY